MEKKFKLGPLQKKWIAYLKKYPEKQQMNFLGTIINGEKKMYCLGAAGLIIGSCKWVGIDLVDGYEETALGSSFEKIGLRNSIGQTLNDSIALALLNDDGDHTWMDIAYILEAIPEEFFTTSL